MKKMQFNKRIRKIFQNPINFRKMIPKQKIILFIITVLLVYFITYYLNFFKLPVNLPKIELGKPATVDVVATKTITYVDQAKTQELKDKVKNSVQPIYRLDMGIQQSVLSSIDDFYERLREILTKEVTVYEKSIMLESLVDSNSDLVDSLLGEDSARVEPLANYSKSLLTTLYINGVRSDTVNKVLEQAQTNINESALSKEEKSLVYFVVSKYVKPNLVYDEKATEEAINEAVSNVPPVRITLEAGTSILAKGEIVTDEHMEILKQLGLLGGRELLKRITVTLVISLIFTLICFIALTGYSENKKKVFSKKYLEFLFALCISLIFMYFAKNITIYLLPIPLFALIVFAFTDLSTALILSLAYSFIITYVLEVPSALIISLLLALIINLYALKRTSRIISFILAGLVGGITFALTTISLNVLERLSFQNILINGAYSFANFFIYTVSSLGLVFMLEHLFNEITTIRLLELSDTNNPILRELLTKAPGTYQHSMLVANLVSSAAEAIGANAILAKVGAYYHDLGKMVNPFYFTENQNGVPNIHNTLSPNLSKSIIVNHVKDGVAIAKKLRFPEEIINFIETHHGKTIVSYFYQKARETDPSTSKDDFRYPGPLPKNKETALLLLADAVEAASHSLDTVDYRKVDELVNTLFDERIKDGQLDESDLDFIEIAKVKESFVKSLISLYHKREKYPNGKENDKN